MIPTNSSKPFISFIVIGKNEGWKLPKCLASIRQTIEVNGFDRAEIIYVDSHSTDGSLEAAQQFSEVRVIHLTGACNAAIARNVGAEISSGDILCFVDGDMELIPAFFQDLFNEQAQMHYPFISGQFRNHYYSQKGEKVGESLYYPELGDAEVRHYTVTGGLFMMERSHWMTVGGMKNKYKKGQDLDLGMRMARRGFLLQRSGNLMAHHHTISYGDTTRSWSMLWTKIYLYSRSTLYRDHLLNPKLYPTLIRIEYTLLALIGSVFLSFLLANGWFLLLTPLLIVAKLFKKKEGGLGYSMQRFGFYLVRDLQVIWGFLFFYPKNPGPVEWEELK